MSRSISFPEARKNTEDKQVPPAREPSAESLRWKRRLIATLATISLFTLLKLGFDSRTKEKIDEIPFLTQAGILQLNSIAASDDDTLGVLVQEDGMSYQDITGWNDTEQERLEKEIEIALAFLKEIFGPPAPWAEKNTVIIMNGQHYFDPRTGLVAGETPMGGLFTNVDLLLVFDPEVALDGTVIAHELEHAREGASEVPWSVVWVEGQADFARKLLAERHPELVSRKMKTELFSPEDYVKFNVPALLTLDYNTANLNERLLIYFMASEAWRKWYDIHPEFFLKMNEKITEFYEKYHMKPSYAILMDLAEAEYPDFKEFRDQNYILQMTTIAQHDILATGK